MKRGLAGVLTLLLLVQCFVLPAYAAHIGHHHDSDGTKSSAIWVSPEIGFTSAVGHAQHCFHANAHFTGMTASSLPMAAAVVHDAAKHLVHPLTSLRLSPPTHPPTL